MSGFFGRRAVLLWALLLSFLSQSCEDGVSPPPVVGSLEVLVAPDSAQVASDASVRIRVLDASGQPISGSPVRFVPLDGGGGAAPDPRPSAGDGTVVFLWSLAPVAGVQRLRIETTGPVQTLSLTATPAVAHALELVSGDAQTGTATMALADSLRVRTVDVHGNPVPDTEVRWEAPDGGVASPTPSTTDASGSAAAAFTLGASLGTYEALAVLEGRDTVSFSAVADTEAPPSAFQVDLEIVGTMSPAAQSDVMAALSRWEEMIIGDLDDVTADIPAGYCGISHAAFNGTVDDVRVFVEITPMDGPGGVLGSAGPCVIRSGSMLPAFGVVRLDSADVASLQSDGSFDQVILHELGHVLGIGSLWSHHTLLFGEGGSDPYFTGSGAIQRYEDLGGTPTGQVPVENTGGSGTRDAHWRESVLGHELMTGWLNRGSSNPISAITLSSLTDMGYVVDGSRAESYSLPGAPVADTYGRPPMPLIEVAPPAPVRVIDASGRLRAPR